MLDRIISYLAQGFTSQQVSDMVGCGEDYVNKVRTDERNVPTIQAEAARHKLATRNDALEAKYTNLEEAVLHQVREAMPFAEFRDLSRTMEVLIRRKQQQSLHAGSINIHNNTQINHVTLSIPKAAAPDIVLNSQREVVAIGDRSLAPLSSTGVRSLFDTLQKKKEAAEALVRAEDPKKHHRNLAFHGRVHGGAIAEEEPSTIQPLFDSEGHNLAPKDF